MYREVAFIAFHFHWSKAEILDLDHRERQQWVLEVAAMLNPDGGS
ncbi:DUF6760 family protein [Roseofilum casamattae]|uniref:DUF6760 domain-containing protein n=1 Tax=Roseofilum casamattae BLCC-M143 TaxID=3022442 RepID=A0ABT7BZR4_9CYAN|nr:DUF6760 family protein [Roseofilum casamattae]MDJ1183758.1 hypothetical protein [Roseofilum casamattae BLCC-M143]